MSRYILRIKKYPPKVSVRHGNILSTTSETDCIPERLWLFLKVHSEMRNWKSPSLDSCVLTIVASILQTCGIRLSMQKH